MMSLAELIALRGRLIAAQANRHTIGAAEAYVRALEAEVALTDFNSRRASVRHLLALVDAALEARKLLPPTNHTRAQPPKPVLQSLRGQSEIAAVMNEAAFPPAPPPEAEKKGGRRKSRSPVPSSDV